MKMKIPETTTITYFHNLRWRPMPIPSYLRSLPAGSRKSNPTAQQMEENYSIFLIISDNCIIRVL